MEWPITINKRRENNSNWDGIKWNFIDTLEVESTRFILGYRYVLIYGQLERSSGLGLPVFQIRSLSECLKVKVINQTGKAAHI